MASRSVNKVTLIGNLTRDPELKYTPQGTAICSFGLATNRTWSTATGELKEDVQFHRIVAWQKLAELCQKLLAKGRKVYLDGRIVYRTYAGSDGVQRTITEIVMDDFVIFDDRRKTDDDADSTSETSSGKSDYPDPNDDIPTTPAAKKSSKSDKIDEKVETAADKKETVTKKKETTSTSISKDEEIDPDDIPF